MSQQLRVHPHLALFTLAALGLAAATAYFLLAIPRQLAPNDPDWLQAGASWATAFGAQIGVFLAVVCPVAAHALSGRWSWSVRLSTAFSAYLAIVMAMLAVDSYQDAAHLTGHIRTSAEFLEGALILAAAFLLYGLLASFTLVWIATRGERFDFPQRSSVPGGSAIPEK